MDLDKEEVKISDNIKSNQRGTLNKVSVATIEKQD